MDLIGASVLGWGVGKVADAVWAKIVGRGPSHALQTALSIAPQEFRDIHPKVHGALFEQPGFGDALQEELVLLLQAEPQRDAKRLAQRIEPLAAVPFDRLERALEDLVVAADRRQPSLLVSGSARALRNGRPRPAAWRSLAP